MGKKDELSCFESQGKLELELDHQGGDKAPTSGCDKLGSGNRSCQEMWILVEGRPFFHASLMTKNEEMVFFFPAFETNQIWDLATKDDMTFFLGRDNKEMGLLLYST